MKKTLFATLAGVLFVIAVPFVYAQSRGGYRGGYMMGGHAGMMGGHAGMNHMRGAEGMGILGHLGAMKEKLGLTDEQTAQLKQIAKETHDQNAPYRDQLRGGMQEVTKILLADPNAVDQARAILDKQEQAQHQMKANMLNAASRALKVLTPEQRTQLGQMIAERQARREARRNANRG